MVSFALLAAPGRYRALIILSGALVGPRREIKSNLEKLLSDSSEARATLLVSFFFFICAFVLLTVGWCFVFALAVGVGVGVGVGVEFGVGVVVFVGVGVGVVAVVVVVAVGVAPAAVAVAVVVCLRVRVHAHVHTNHAYIGQITKRFPRQRQGIHKCSCLLHGTTPAPSPRERKYTLQTGAALWTPKQKTCLSALFQLEQHCEL